MAFKSLDVLSRCAVFLTISDSTSIKVHQHASGIKKGAKMSQQDAAGED